MNNTVEFGIHIFLTRTWTLAFGEKTFGGGWGDVVLKRMLLWFYFPVYSFSVLQPIATFRHG